jgi:hypothetical protein
VNASDPVGTATVGKPAIARLPRGTRARQSLTAVALAAVAAVLILGGCTSQAPAPLSGIRKIQHVVIIMQENRSFDSFFGTFPGADGIPAANGQFTVCVLDPRTHGISQGCVKRCGELPGPVADVCGAARRPRAAARATPRSWRPMTGRAGPASRKPGRR